MSVETPVTPGPKKGMPVWGWLAIGCGVIVVLGIGGCFAAAYFVQQKAKSVAEDFEKNPAKAAAELAVRMNPDVELVSSTDEAMTIRDKKTGEVITVDFEDAKEGKFTFRGKEGQQATIDIDAAKSGDGGTMKITGTDGQTAVFGSGAGAANVPDWVPLPPGGSAIGGNYDAKTAEGHAGAVTVTTSDSVEKLMAFYKDKLEGAGFKVQTMTLAGATSGGTVTGTSADQKRSVNVVVSVTDGKTQAIVTFNEGK